MHVNVWLNKHGYTHVDETDDETNFLSYLRLRLESLNKI